METEMSNSSTPPESCSITDKISAPELLQEIFSYLNGNDLKSVRLVCKRWREVSFLASLNHNIVVSVPNIDSSTVSELITSGFYISNLNYGNHNSPCTTLVDPFWSYIGPSLMSLKLTNLQFDTEFSVLSIVECCPNLQYLGMELCSGIVIEPVQHVVKLNLSELRIDYCDIDRNSVVTLVSSLAPNLWNFLYRPTYEPGQRNLKNNQLMELFRLVCRTLEDVDITWEKPSDGESEIDLDFDAIFGIPDLNVRNVSLECPGYFNEILDALITYQGGWLEEVCLIDNMFPLHLQIERYLEIDWPTLRKFRCASIRSFNFNSISALSSLIDLTVESRAALMEIEVDDFVHLSRKISSERFVILELMVIFDDDLFVEERDETVLSFILSKRLDLLTILNLEGIDLSHQGMSDVVFENCIKIRDLRLVRCNLSDSLLLNGVDTSIEQSDADWDAIMECAQIPFMKLTELVKLEFVDNVHLTSLSITRVIKFPRLKHLALVTSVTFCDHRFVHLAINNPSLEEACFEDTNLTNQPIVEFVRNAPNLVNLDIMFNPMLTDYALCEIAKHNKLRILDVYGCEEITSECVQSVHSRNKALKITYGGYTK